MYIGKNDDGEIIGVKDYRELLEKIPNKIKDKLGISAEVILLQEDDKYYIEVVVHPYANPISYQGRFYTRGSTKQELTGSALSDFLLKRYGRTWDDMEESRASYTFAKKL